MSVCLPPPPPLWGLFVFRIFGYLYPSACWDFRYHAASVGHQTIAGKNPLTLCLERGTATFYSVQRRPWRFRFMSTFSKVWTHEETGDYKTTRLLLSVCSGCHWSRYGSWREFLYFYFLILNVHLDFRMNLFKKNCLTNHVFLGSTH